MIYIIGCFICMYMFTCGRIEYLEETCYYSNGRDRGPEMSTFWITLMLLLSVLSWIGVALILVYKFLMWSKKCFD